MKTLKESSADKKDLLHELAVMKMLEPHPNVVKLLGCCTDKGMNLPPHPNPTKRPLTLKIFINLALSEQIKNAIPLRNHKYDF